jgi:Fe2+ transport system protein FeoA
MSRSGRPGREVRCGLCGHRFDPSALACHSECPLGAHCTLICCPRCGYQVVDTGRTFLGRLLARLLRTRPEPAPGPVRLREPAEPRETIPLSHVLPGREVEVVSLRDLPGPRASRLAAFGIVPGSRVEVLQRRPTPVIRVGETEIALGPEVLERIEVTPPEPTSRPATA